MHNKLTTWESTIHTCLVKIGTRLQLYLESEHFKSEWHYWNHNPPYAAAIAINMCICNSFPFSTTTTSTIELVVESSVMAQLNLLNRLLYPYPLPTIDIVKEALNRVGYRYMDNNSLHELLCNEYKRLAHACELIQHAWRQAIACPAYAMCKRRLLNEFQALNDKHT